MAFACRAVDASVFDSASMRFKHVAELPVPARRAFPVLEDPASWPVWFRGIRKVTWTSPQPFGVGTTRTVVLDLLTVREHFFRWEAPHRMSFYLTEMSLPVASVLAEDYLLEDLDGDRCRFTYTVAVEPRLMARLARPVAAWQLNRMFANGAKGLARYLAT